MAQELKLAPDRYRIRAATKADVPGMTEVFFKSFNAPFWAWFFADNKVHRDWWDEAWAMGIDNPTDRSFVVEDTEQDNRIVAFSRWMAPQQDGNIERPWPEVNESVIDMEVGGAFFGGMEANREALMGKRPHWMLEMLGVHEDYQGQGIAASLIKYGTDLADRDGLETYLDASEVARPYYKKRHGFHDAKIVPIPDRPEYGTFQYMTMIRPPQK